MGYTVRMNTKEPFSKQLKNWLASSKPNTAYELQVVFGQRSFAVVFLILLALPALPIPTGGITHVLEVLCILLALEQIIGLKSIWLPKIVRNRPLPLFVVKTALPALIKKLVWFEKHSRRRGEILLHNPLFSRLYGLLVAVTTVFIFFSPPFSGLDTIPSLGVVLMSLGVILGDVAYFIVGLLVAVLGIFIEVFFGAAVLVAARHYILHGSPTSKIIMLSLLLAIVVFLVVRHRKK